MTFILPAPRLSEMLLVYSLQLNAYLYQRSGSEISLLGLVKTSVSQPIGPTLPPENIAPRNPHTSVPDWELNVVKDSRTAMTSAM